MTESLVAHRFQTLRTLQDRGGVRLEVARDVASEATGTLLTLCGARYRWAEGILRFRLRAFAGRPLFRTFEPDVVVWSDDSLHVFVDPLEGESWAAHLMMLDPPAALQACQRLDLCLCELEGQLLLPADLRLEQIFTDPDGDYLLPSAYAVAPDHGNGSGTGGALDTLAPSSRLLSPLRRELSAFVLSYLDRRPDSEQDEAIAKLRRQASLWQTASIDATAPTTLPWIEAIEDLEEEGGALVFTEPGGPPSQWLDGLQQWSQGVGRRLRLLRPHLHEVDDVLRLDPQEQAVVVIDGLYGYAPFAEGLQDLADAGWMDGREILVVTGGRREPDESAQLFLSWLRNRTGERFRRLDSAPAAPPSPPATMDLAGLPGRILDALEVAGRPLSEKLLCEAFALGTEHFARLAFTLWTQGWIDVSFLRADDAPPYPQMILSARADLPPLTSPERRREIQVVLSSTLEGLGERGGIGRAWLRLEAALVTDPGKLPGLVRKLVTRAQKHNQRLLQYAAYDLLLRHAKDTQPRIEDRCQAAICMGEEHRLQGDLSRADAMYSQALTFLESAHTPPGRAATLAADLVLKMSNLAFHRGAYQDAAHLLSETLERYKDELPAIGRGRLYLDLSRALLRLGRTRESVRHAEITLKLLDSERYSDEVARAYNLLGSAFFDESNYSQSLLNYQRCLVLREQIGDTLGVAQVHNNLSLTYRAMGKLVEAERRLRRSLELKYRVGDVAGVAASQLNLGLILIEQAKWEEARKCATECLHLAQPLGQRAMEAEAYGLLGEIAMGEGRHAEARELLSKDLEICQAIGHATERLATLRRLVALLLLQDDLDGAALHLEEARQAQTIVKSRFESAMLDASEAELLARTSALEPAVDVYGSAARIFSQLNRFDLQLRTLVARGLLEIRLERTSHAQQTLAACRELVAEHELHHIPAGYHELEARLGDLQAEPAHGGSGSERFLALLTSLLDPSHPRPSDRIETALQALLATLSCEQAYWLRTSAAWGVTRGAEAVETPPEELLALRDEVGQGGETVIEAAGWILVRTRSGGGEWLALAVDHALEPRAMALVKAVAGWLGIAETPSAAAVGPPAPTGQEAPRFGLVGRSPAFRKVLNTIEHVKENDVGVLLLGESGTGKDVIARAIHRSGRRRQQPFIAVNCAALPPTLLESELFGHEKGAFTSAHERRVGVFERAHGGTIFLDEIGEMSQEMQAKLLRVLQDKSFTRVGGTRTIETDVRVLAATNRDLQQAVDQGRFRTDLFFRLNVVTIHVPPLRERREDIPVLAQHFLERFAGEFRSPVRSMSREVAACLAEYPWPGNVRELENTIKNMMVFAEHATLQIEDLPAPLVHPESTRPSQSVEDAVRAMIEADDYSEERPLMPRIELLAAHQMVRAIRNKTQAARLLGITKPTLYNRLQRFDALYGDRPLDDLD